MKKLITRMLATMALIVVIPLPAASSVQMNIEQMESVVGEKLKGCYCCGCSCGNTDGRVCVGG